MGMEIKRKKKKKKEGRSVYNMNIGTSIADGVSTT